MMMITTRNSAWVKAGVAVNATSAAYAAEQAGLDWTVELANMYVERKTVVSPYDTITENVYVPRRKAVIKRTEDSESVIGVVGDKYKIVQNMEVFSALDTLIDSGDARYAAAGEYNNGASVFMVLELPKGIHVANDPHAAFLLVRTSHDGSSSVAIKPIIERLFCANQINGLISNKRYNSYTYRMKHTSNSKLSVNDIRNIIQLTYDAVNEYEVTADALLQKSRSHGQAREFFEKVWALPTEVANSPYHLLSQGQKRQHTLATTARERAYDIYTESPTQENIRGTAFGLWQAVVEYADHYAGTDDNRRAVNALSGTSDKVKTKALALLTV
jgi:phage/plasmid-like protein (TIGR03299 family)